MKKKMIHEIIVFACLFLILVIGMHLYSCKEKQLSFSETPDGVTITGENVLLGAIYTNTCDLSVKDDKLHVTYLEIAFDDIDGLEQYQEKTAPIQIKLYYQTENGEEEVWLKEKMGDEGITLYYTQNLDSTGDLRVEVTYSYGTNNQKAQYTIRKEEVELAQND